MNRTAVRADRLAFVAGPSPEAQNAHARLVARYGDVPPERADVIVLQVIKDQLGKRPIYFSRTVGLYADQFGLTGHLEGQGFARALRPKELAPSDSIKAIQSLGYVNVPRTSKLLFDVYHADEAARPRPLGWLDKPSEGILQLYGLTYYTMAQELQKTNTALSARAQQIAQSIFRNTETPVQPLPEQPGPPH